MLDKAVLIQFLVSAAAVAALVGLAGWARIARPTPPLEVEAARDLIAAEFPGRPIDGLWIAAKGEGAVARSADLALVVYRAGDAYVARSLDWNAALSAEVGGGFVHFRIADIAAPRAALSVSGINPWPPQALAA